MSRSNTDSDSTRSGSRPDCPALIRGRTPRSPWRLLSVLHRIWRPLDKRKMVDGIENARWEGRLELVATRPRFYLDGAHNEAGAAVLRSFIRNDLRARPVLVFAMMKDKAVGRAVEAPFPEAKKVILTSIPYARAAKPEEIARLGPAVREEDPHRAVARARPGPRPPRSRSARRRPRRRLALSRRRRQKAHSE